MNRNRIYAAALAGLLLATGGAYACERMGRDGAACMRDGGFGPVGAAYHVKDLTADQRTQLDALREQQRARHDAMQKDRDALHQAMANAADPEALRPLAEKEGQRVTEMIMEQAKMRAAVDEILTDAQRAELKEMSAAGGRHHGPMRHGR